MKRTPLARHFAFVVLLLTVVGGAILVVSGCAGHGTPAPSATVSNASFQIDWPTRTRQFSPGLTSALSAAVTFKKASTTGQDIVMNIDRNVAPAAYTGSYVVGQPVLASTSQMTINFYAGVGEAGAVVGSATATVTFTGANVNLARIVLSGVIKSVIVTPPASVIVGSPAFQLTFTAIDANANVVAVTPGSASWTVTTGQNFLTVTPDGIATPVAIGSASVVATVDGVASTATPVSIIAATIPGLATTGWPKLGGNMFNSNYTSASPSLSLSLLKTFNAGGPVFSSPAIDVNGNAYFGSEDGHVYALDKDGNQLWAYQTGGKIDSSPSIASDGTIYIGSNDSNLYALNPNGSVKWTYKATASITSGTSIGADGTVYFVTSDSMLNALVPPGTLKWASKIGRVLYSSPAIASDGTLYIGSIDGYLFSVSSSGNVNWKANYLGVITQPVITPQGWIVCDNSVDFAFAVDSTNTLQWGFDTDGIVDQGGAAVGPDGSSYLGSDSGTLYSISPSGIINWKYSAGAAIVTAPVVDGAGNIYTAVENGKILKLDPTGKLLASYTGSSVLFDRSSPALWSGGRIFIGSGNGSAMQVFN